MMHRPVQVLRSLLLLSIFSCAVPAIACALDLRWADGNRSLIQTVADRCTLVVRPQAGSPTLPAAWRLVYIGTSSCAPESAVVFLDAPGPIGAAPVCSIDPPSTLAEQVAHQITVSFCGPNEAESTESAAYVVRIDPSFSGRIAAVDASPGYPGAVDYIPADAEVTVNDGTALMYPPVVWSAFQRPNGDGSSSLALQGVGLGQVRSLILASGESADGATVFKSGSTAQVGDTLVIDSQTSNVITAQSGVPILAGQTLVLAGGSNGAAATVELSPAQANALNLTDIGPMNPGPLYFPKDFALVYSSGLFHVFYIRHKYGAPEESTEVDFGHAVWSPASGWTQLAPVVPTRAAKWDNSHVWAPTIIYDKQTSLYYMFYTGVSYVPFAYPLYQRMGVATSPDLVNWARYDSPVFSGNQAQQVFADSSQFSGCQFRDPYVMEDPTAGSAGNWLMFFGATPAGPASQFITHVARNGGGLAPWASVMPLWNTDLFPGGNPPHYVGFTESPHVFVDGGRWYLFYTSNAGHRISFQFANSPVADSMSWSELRSAGV